MTRLLILSVVLMLTMSFPVDARRRTCWGRKITIRGNGIVLGTPERDVIRTGRGRDFVFAGSGRDFVCAGSGDDQIDGGNGFDSARAHAGNDSCANVERMRSC